MVSPSVPPLGPTSSASRAPRSPRAALPTAWPADLCSAVDERSAAALDDPAPAAPSLDLGWPDGRRLLRDAAFLATGVPRTGESHASGESGESAEVPQPASFASIVSVAGLVHFADLPLALRGMSYLLAPGGTVHLLEPIGVPGIAAFVAASLTDGLRRWRPEVRRLHLHRDVPAAIRAEGLTITTIERFSMAAPVPSLHTWMYAVAAPIAPRHPAAAAPAAPSSPAGTP